MNILGHPNSACISLSFSFLSSILSSFWLFSSFIPTTQLLQPGMEKRKQNLFHDTLSIYGSSYHRCQNIVCKTIIYYAHGFHGLRIQTEHAEDGLSQVCNVRHLSWEDSKTGLTQQLGTGIIGRHFFLTSGC